MTSCGEKIFCKQSQGDKIRLSGTQWRAAWVSVQQCGVIACTVWDGIVNPLQCYKTWIVSNESNWKNNNGLMFVGRKVLQKQVLKEGNMLRAYQLCMTESARLSSHSQVWYFLFLRTQCLAKCRFVVWPSRKDCIFSRLIKRMSSK